MKKYLIEIYNTRGTSMRTTLNGDMPACPFSISGNLWVYMTPWNAARRLEMIAKKWEKRGLTVNRVYGTVADMPSQGNITNVVAMLREWNERS